MVKGHNIYPIILIKHHQVMM